MTGEWVYRSYLVLDLAPGGSIKGWVTGSAGVSNEIGCTSAEIVPRGSFQGERAGRHVKLNKSSDGYVASHPIPFAGWNCRK
ncbi:hypothetical protein ACHZ97_12085 [Lysobacter soli]|uniref:hypothetical protein n=1 Tax=Lysobacter soli TaxID=453783 RepID=UPI0037C69634